MEENNSVAPIIHNELFSEDTIKFIKKCYIHLNQARHGVWAFADLSEIVWHPKVHKKNKELYFSIVHDAIAYEIIKYEELLEMSELKTDFLNFYSSFVSKINTSHEYTNFLEDRINTLENRFGLVWKEQEEQLLKIVSEKEIVLGVGRFLINEEYEFISESKDKKKKIIKDKQGKDFTLTRKRGDSFIYFCKDLDQLFLIYSVQSKINIYSFVENHYTKYYPILVKKGEKFGFGEVRDNLLIEGDNYYALQLLQFTHREKIDFIYIDPPYNTGTGDFKYNDAYVGSDDGSRHSKWLSFMKKRLELSKSLLSELGAILISIDDNEQANLKVICDQIFGEENFHGMITWQKRTKSTNSGKAKFSLQQNIEYVLLYTKKKKSEYPGFILKIEGERKYPHQYKDRTCRFENIHCTDEGRKKRDTMKYSILGINPPPRRRWQFGEEQARTYEKEDKIVVLDGMPKLVIYPEDESPGVMKPFWSNLPLAITGSAEVGKKTLTDILGDGHGFDTVKPVELICQIMQHFPKNITVLDFFAGSGTTGQAVIHLNNLDGGNRKYILCTNNESNICEDITYKRLMRINSPSSYDLNINSLPHGLDYLQVKHISDLALENADDSGNFEYVKHINNVKFNSTRVILENDSIYLTDKYSVFKKKIKNKKKEYIDFFDLSIKNSITNIVFLSSDTIEYDYFRKIISDHISKLPANSRFRKRWRTIMTIELKKYQKDAADFISKNIRDNIWTTKKKNDYEANVLKAITGAGKTVILSEIINQIDAENKDDYCIFWLSSLPEVNQQSKLKIEKYNSHLSNKLLTLDSSNYLEGLKPQHIYFLNYSKLSESSNMNKGGADSNNISFWDLPFNKLKIIFIVDEAHLGSSQTPSQSKSNKTILNKLIEKVKPKFVVGASATPEDFKNFVESINVFKFGNALSNYKATIYAVPVNEVCDSGMIKSELTNVSLKIQTSINNSFNIPLFLDAFKQLPKSLVLAIPFNSLVNSLTISTEHLQISTRLSLNTSAI